MRHVKRGQGIKFLDEQLEIASFRALIGVYSPLISIENPDNLNEVLFAFQLHIYKEYEKLYVFLIAVGTHYKECDCMERRIVFLKSSIEQKLFIAPSEILLEFDHIKRLKKLIQVQEVSVSCCIKLK